MQSLPDLLQQGTTHAWLFVPTAILLGALHGLEPGHSKTMMAAFIIAIRGTVGQAVLLGLSGVISTPRRSSHISSSFPPSSSPASPSG